MFSENLKFFTRTSIWRFTIFFVLIILLACSGILAVIYHFTVIKQQDQFTQNVLSAAKKIKMLSTKSIRIKNFSHTIYNRTENSKSLVLVLKYKNKIIGNLSHFPTNIPTYPKLGRFPIIANNYLGEPELTIVIGTQVNTRFGNLIIGLFQGKQKEQKKGFLLISISILGGVLLITLSAGLLFNWRVLSRIQQIGELVLKIQTGQLEARLPISNRKDEYDVISGQINSMLDEIDNLIDSVTSVTDNIAHDLRTPLSRIRIRIDHALEQTTPNSIEEEWHLKLLEELDHVIETFNAMLELSRIEKGAFSIEQKHCDLTKICQDVADLIFPVANEKLHFDFCIEEEGAVKGEASLLFRAIYNIVENAVLYTQEQGTVKMILQGNTIVIEDNGSGIPEDELENVFQRLYRVDKSRHSKGFGLGLSMVKAIINRHEGNIKLENKNQGLKVTIQF
ncbi:MAG: signal transduction histidine kinase [bacterium]|jgi:signal transduction histidine kinase